MRAAYILHAQNSPIPTKTVCKYEVWLPYLPSSTRSPCGSTINLKLLVSTAIQLPGIGLSRGIYLACFLLASRAPGILDGIAFLACCLALSSSAETISGYTCILPEALLQGSNKNVKAAGMQWYLWCINVRKIFRFDKTLQPQPGNQLQ